MAIIPAEEKVFMVSNSTNTTYSGSAALKAMQQWYTMEDVTNTVRPYQVFTALLTQSGGDNPLGNCSDDPQPLIIGGTYTISVADGTADFTNVGAPNNNIGTYFIATGTIPNSWGTSGDNCLDYNTGAPVATVLENTIGNVWFTYGQIGVYAIRSSELFTDKTFMELSNVTNVNNNSSGSAFTGLGLLESNSHLGIQSVGLTDGDMYNTPIEIRVYN